MPVNQIQSFSSVRCWLGAENNSSDRPVSGNNGIEDFDPEKTQLTINNLDAAARADYDSQPPEEQEVTRETLRILSDRTRVRRLEAEIDEEIAREVAAIDREAPISFTEKKKLNKNNVGFWADDEDDEFGQVPDGDDEFLGDDMTTPAHGQLDLHRDMREYQRRIAWDMPLLRKFARPFSPPPLTSPLRFRYTTYMGEHHPAAKKVVVELCTRDIFPSPSSPFTPEQLQRQEQQRNKLIKLAGVRYNPSTDVIKMSCEKFETQAQNKRYLGDLVANLIKEATDPTKDTFEDVPFDFRHHRPRKVVPFPEEWKLGSPDRVRELVQAREKRRSLAERSQVVVDGDAIVKQYVEAVAPFQTRGPNVPLVGAGHARGKARGARELARR